MKIKIKCFSQVKYAFGKNELNMEVETGITAFDLEKIIREKAKSKLDNVTLKVSVNKKYCKKYYRIKEGDEVAFIPPVQGG